MRVAAKKSPNHRALAKKQIKEFHEYRSSFSQQREIRFPYEHLRRLSYQIRLAIIRLLYTQVSLVIEDDKLLTGTFVPPISSHSFSGAIRDIFKRHKKDTQEAKISKVTRFVYGYFQEDRFRKPYLVFNCLEYDVLITPRVKKHCSLFHFAPRGHIVSKLRFHLGMSEGKEHSFVVPQRRSKAVLV